MYALGMTFYYMMHKRFIFPDEIKKEKYDFIRHYSDELKNVVRRILRFEEFERATIQEVLEFEIIKK